MKLGSYCFDVGSDILNGINLLQESRFTAVNGIFNSTTEDTFLQNETKFYNFSARNQEGRATAVNGIFNLATESPFLQNETKFYNVSNGNQENVTGRPDTIWGALTLTFVLMPGLIFGVIDAI